MSADTSPSKPIMGNDQTHAGPEVGLLGVRIDQPTSAKAPIVFSSPHSGTYYPKRMRDALKVPLLDLRRTEDAFVDRLFADVPTLGGTLVSAVYARGYVDLNRAKDELDGTMFEGGLSQPAGERSPRVEAGLGCIPRIGASGRNIYARKLDRDEADDRLARAYDPYHSALSDIVAQLRDAWNQVFVIDCHSMPSTCHGRRMAADFVLGDRYGSACTGALISTVERFLRGQGYKVARNAPYAGGFITERHGRPHRQTHALQIEINRSLYLNERDVALSKNFDALRSDLQDLTAYLTNWARAAAEPKKSRAS